MLLGSKLLEVVSKPGALGLREKLNEDRAGWAIRSWYICREGVETTTWPQLPQAGVIRHRIRASEEGPSARSGREHSPSALWEVRELDCSTPLWGKS